MVRGHGAALKLNQAADVGIIIDGWVRDCWERCLGFVYLLRIHTTPKPECSRACDYG